MRLRRPALIAAGLAGTVILAAACGSSSTSTTAPTGGAAATAPASTPTLTTGTGTDGPQALPSRPVPIPAAAYTTSVFRPQLALSLPAGWSLADAERPVDLYLANDAGSLRVLRVSGLKVFPPGASPSVAAARPAPADLGAWLRANPAVKVTGSGTTTIAGQAATTIDATPTTGDALLFLVGEFPAGIRAGTAARFTLVGDGPTRLLVVHNARPDGLAAFATSTAPILAGLGIDPSVPPATAPATAGNGCDATRTLPDMGHDHVDTPPNASAWNSFPPTSGSHNPQWAPWGISKDPLPQFTLIHNLEHGGIVVQYGPTADRAAVEQWASADLPGIVVAPLTELGNRIALTAWTHLLNCAKVDTRAFDAFRDAYRFRGREFFPIDAYAPGTAA
jgi:hypothetical protein